MTFTATQYANPQVLVVTGATETIDSYSYAEFTADGVGCTVDFGGGNIYPLEDGEKLRAEIINRPYNTTDVTAPAGSTVKCFILT